MTGGKRRVRVSNGGGNGGGSNNSSSGTCSHLNSDDGGAGKEVKRRRSRRVERQQKEQRWKCYGLAGTAGLLLIMAAGWRRETHQMDVLQRRRARAKALQHQIQNGQNAQASRAQDRVQRMIQGASSVLSKHERDHFAAGKGKGAGTGAADKHRDANHRPQPRNQRRHWAKLKEFVTAKIAGSSPDGDAEAEAEAGPHRHSQDTSKGDATGAHRWVDPILLPPLPGKNDQEQNPLLDENMYHGNNRPKKHAKEDAHFFVSRKGDPPMEWEVVADNLDQDHAPKIDYTAHEYKYPELLWDPPRSTTDGTLQYPLVRKLGDILAAWPQDDLDQPPSPFVETLMHFDYNDPKQQEASIRFRNLELPFKIYNVPELQHANEKWTDEYVAEKFDGHSQKQRQSLRGGDTDQEQPLNEVDWEKMPPPAPSQGTAQESPNNFFAFFSPQQWSVPEMGTPPTKDNDWPFAKWAKHARYADQVGLNASEPHYYWQSGVPAHERAAGLHKWSFVSRDLPSFSDPKPTFFSFNPREQKGIQCRFGERGVVAATHYDSGRNMVGMITGAKRYILAPPTACSNLGIVKTRGHPIFRHSLLNFGHIALLSDTDIVKDMSIQEQEWLQRAYDSQAIDTVLKSGEVLYIPSYWFHYIISLQKSAQCNVRSGRDEVGTPEWGSRADVESCEGDKD